MKPRNNFLSDNTCTTQFFVISSLGEILASFPMHVMNFEANNNDNNDDDDDDDDDNGWSNIFSLCVIVE